MRSILILLSGAALAFGQYSARAAALDRDLTAWQAQGTTVSDDQLLNRVNTLGTSFQGFVPITPGDYQANRELVRRSLSYLAQVEPRAYANPALGRRVAGTYGSLGDYQNRPAFRSQRGYGQGAAFGYAGAGRISRRMYLGGYGSERDVERYAMQLAGMGSGYGYGYGYGMYNRQRPPQGLDAVDLGPIEDNGKKPLPLPAVDTSKMTAEQRAAWSDLSLEFVAVSSRVHQAQQSLDSLEQRLRRQGMDVNPSDRAVSYQMDGFLQDSAALAVAGDFAKAKVALDRASYLRNKLKSVVGD
jgi:hypothetical protein